MSAENQPSRASHLDGATLHAAAAAITIAWFFVYNTLQRHYLVDEGGHLGNVYHFLEGKPGWPEQMTMLPGYHFIVAALWQLHPPCSLLTLARLVTLVSALAGLGFFALAWRRLHAGGAAPATLLFALFPLLQPFNAMAYTDTIALASVLAATAAQWHGRRGLAAGLFALSALFRQTNLIWAGFAVAVEAVWVWREIADGRSTRGFLGAVFRRTGWLLLILTIGAAFVLAAGRVSVGTATGTEMRPNIATLHCAALLALVLGLPAWLVRLPNAVACAVAAARNRPLATGAIALGAAAAVLVLTRTYANPHVWNRDLFWDGETFTLLRNWPLVWIERHAWLRVASAVNIVAMAGALVVVFTRAPRRAELWLAFAIGALPALLNNLVEPRYFIPGAVLVLLLLEMETRVWRALAVWWALLCAAHAPFIARGLSLW